MKLRSLADALTPDKRSLAFSSTGLKSTTPEERSLEYLQRIVEFTLVDAVPSPVRRLFERVQRLFPCGLWAYDLFTVLEDDAYLMLETALQYKFLQYHATTIPLANNRNGERQQLRVQNYDQVEDALRRGGTLAKDGWRLEGDLNFDCSFKSLLRWARAKHLFYGQRNRVVEDALLNLRNMAAHPHPRLIDPPSAAGTLKDVGEMINRLWDCEGGRLYPPPVRREVVALSLGGPGQPCEWIAAERLPQVTDVFKQGAVHFFLAAPQNWDDIPDVLIHFPMLLRYDVLSLPVRHLWGPGPWPSAVQSWQNHRTDPAWLPDTIEILDQHFWVRQTDSGDWRGPFRSSYLDAIIDDDKSGTWFEVLADSPRDVRENLMHLPGLPPLGEQPIPKLPDLMKAPPITTARRFASWSELTKYWTEGNF